MIKNDDLERIAGQWRGWLVGAAGAVLTLLVFCLVMAVVMGRSAQAQGYTYAPACLPSAVAPKLGDPLPQSSTPRVTWNATHVCVAWDCMRTGSFTTPTYCGTVASQHLVGARLQTIQKADDPLKSLQTLGQRIQMVPMTDPSMAGRPK